MEEAIRETKNLIEGEVFLVKVLLTTLFDLKLVALFGQEGQEVLPSRFS